MQEYLPLSVVSISFAACIIVTLGARRILTKRKSGRSIPSCGWAMMVIIVPGMALAAAVMAQSFLLYIGLIIGALVLAFVFGFENSKQKPRDGRIMRASIYLFAACLGSLAFPTQAVIFGGLLPFELDRAAMIVIWAWFIHLYRTMDGIDGLTCATTIALATGLCLVMAAMGSPDPFASALTLLLTGACLGFLALNWHPAKILAGDSGSVPLGFLTGFLLLGLATKGHAVPALILPLYYLTDGSLSLARKKPFYGRLAQKLKRQDFIVYRVLTANAVLIFAALIAVADPLAGLVLALATVAVLLGWMHKAGRTRLRA